MSSNPVSIEKLFIQLNEDIRTHLITSSGLAAVTLRINSYSRLIKAHPENTHANPNIPSTKTLMAEIDEHIKLYGTYNGCSSNSLIVKAYTRIIAGRK